MNDDAAHLEQALAYARELRSLYDSTRAQTARLRLLIELGKELHSSRDVETLLKLALERATSFSGYDSGSVILLAGPEGPLLVRASVGSGRASVGTRIDDLERSLAGRALARGSPVVVEGVGADVGIEWRDYIKPTPSSVCLPLVTTGGEALGVLALANQSGPVPLDEQDIEALQLLAAQLASAIESVQLSEKLKDLVARLLTAQEEERRRVAYEIHDGLAQIAAGAHLHLQAFARSYRPRSPETRAALMRALDLTQKTVREARRVITGLRPTTLDDFGLSAAIRREVMALQETGWEVTFDDGLGASRFPSPVETALFRVVQEALTNVQKHARTQRVRVDLERRDGSVSLCVRDWGCGFDDRTMALRTGPSEAVGIAGMQERVALLGGRCTVTSRPGHGTTVTAVLPCAAESPVGI